MQLFFVRDSRNKFRFFSSRPPADISVRFSRFRKLWESAKEKLLLILPYRVRSQEQTFADIRKSKELFIHHAGIFEAKKIRLKFYLFLQKERSKHIFLLFGETLLLPLSALAALLPGPNIFFGVLALLMYMQWNALKGIHCLLKHRPQFVTSSLLFDWEKAVEENKEAIYPEILSMMEKEYHLNKIQKILWK